jgi:hypothetical protein
MKKNLKMIAQCALLIVSTIGVARFCHYQTAGFRMSKIAQNYILGEKVEPPDAQTNAILGQKFRYLGRGMQSFAFVSEDDKYVLKLFNNKYQKKLYNKELCAQKLQKTFNSYKIAYSLMKEECGLVYMQLSPSQFFEGPTIIIDKLNISHSIDLNNSAFVIQKKADNVYSTLQKLLEQDKIEEAKRALFSLLCLIDRKLQKVSDTDPLIRTNMGFIGLQAIQIDLGPFAPTPSTNRKSDFKHITTSLKNWLQDHAPNLVTYVEEYQKSMRDEG